MLAVMLLTCVCAFAQSENGEPLKGDVNGDDVVDIADVVAVLKIMKDGGGTIGGPVTYYWYVGTEDPMTMTAITNPIPSNDPSTASLGPGWRTIGTTLPTYSKTNPLWNNDYPINVSDTKVIIYVALPSDQIKERNEAIAPPNNDSTENAWNINSEKKTLNGVDYTVWSSKISKKILRSTLY
jgi:hypothetical protein